MRTEVITEAGNDITLARCQCLQAGPGDFFSAFLVLGGKLLLPSLDVKFRLGRARAEGADANAVRLHFLGEPFGKKKIEGLRGGVGRNIRDRLKSGRGGENQNIAAASRHHVWKKKAREVNDSGAIHLHHIEQALRGDLGEFTVLAEAGVVDEEFDGEAFLLCEREDFFGSVALGQVCDKHFGLDCMDFLQSLRKSLQTIAPTRAKEKVSPASGELGS